MTYHHRNMKKADLKQVLEIERLCFQQPYSREIMEQELKAHAAHLWVVPYRRRIVAYLDFWHVADELELVSIAVHPRYRGRGIAEFLMEAMLNFGKRHHVQHFVLDVRKSNEKARALYEKFGFKQVGLRKKYYSDNQEDAVIMKLEP